MLSEPPAPFEHRSTERRLTSSDLAKADVQAAPARVLGGAGFALALLALAIGVRALFVCGCALLCLRVVAASWVRVGIRGAYVRRRLPERRVVEGQPLEAVIEVHGRHPRLAGMVVEDEFSGARLEVAGDDWQRRAPAVTERRVVSAAMRRGRRRFQAPALLVEDPLGLARARRQRVAGEDEVLVLPRTEAVSWTARGLQAVGAEPQQGQVIFGAGEVDGVREYQAATPAARIYWPSLARGSALLERRLVAAADTRPTVLLDCRGETSAAGLEQLDAAVRAVASLALALGRERGCSVLLPGAAAPLVVGHSARAWEAVRTQLALAELEPYERRAPAIPPQALNGPLLYVSSAPVPLGAPLTSSRYPVIHVLPQAASPYESPPVLQVCGCSGYALRRGVTRRSVAA